MGIHVGHVKVNSLVLTELSVFPCLAALLRSSSV